MHSHEHAFTCVGRQGGGLEMACRGWVFSCKGDCSVVDNVCAEDVVAEVKRCGSSVAWLGYYPSQGATRKSITGSHMVGFTRESIADFGQWLDDSGGPKMKGLDTWLRDQLPSGRVTMGKRMAYQRNHGLEKRR